MNLRNPLRPRPARALHAVLLGLVVVLMVVPAWAETQADESEPTAEEPSNQPSDGYGTVHAEGVDPLQATPVQVEQAQARFVRGKQLYESGEYQQAMEEFSASRAVVASPNARLYRARCLRQLGRRVEAYSEFGRTMVEALELAKLEVRYSRTAASATEERAELETQLGFLSITILTPQAETEVYVNDEQIRRTAWGESIPVEPGDIVVKVETPGSKTLQRQVQLAPGASQELSFQVVGKPTPQPQLKADASPTPVATPAEPPADYTPYAYVSAGVAAAGFGAFTVFGMLSQKKHDELQKACPDGLCPPDEADALRTGKSQQLWANIGLAVGVAGLGTAITLWALDEDDTEGDVALELSPSGVSLRGRL